MAERSEQSGLRRANWKDDCVNRRVECQQCYYIDRWPDRPKCHKSTSTDDSVATDRARAKDAEVVLRKLLTGKVKAVEIEKDLELIVSVGALALKKLTELRELRKGVG